MLRGRSSAPARPKGRVASAVRAAIGALRRTRLSVQAIADRLALPRSTVGAVLRNLGLGRLSALETKPPIIRYQRERPGELVHIDSKKLRRIEGVGHRNTGNRRDGKRGIGWEALHVTKYIWISAVRGRDSRPELFGGPREYYTAPTRHISTPHVPEALFRLRPGASPEDLSRERNIERTIPIVAVGRSTTA